MPEQTPRDLLQPSLLDRLTDDEPQKQMESRDKRVLSMRQLKEAVLRDLAWLLNTANFDSEGKFDEYPFAAESVVNFGTRRGRPTQTVNWPYPFYSCLAPGE